MNVLFYTRESPFFRGPYGGAESSMRLISEKMVSKGHKAVFLSRAQQKGMLPIIKPKSFGGVLQESVVQFRGGSFAPVKAANRGIMKRKINHIMKSYRIDVVYCSYELDFLLPLLELRNANGSNFKVVMRMAGMNWYERCLRNPQLVRVYEYVFNALDSVNFIHEDLWSLFEEKVLEQGMNVTFQNVFIGDIGTSAPMDWGSVRCSDGGGPLKIIMAARFSDYQKRQDLLIRAISLIDDVPLTVELIGDGTERRRLAQMVEKLGQKRRIRILPFLDRHDLWMRMREADLLCHACDYEGLGKTVIEALALGLPVLASNVPTINGYIHDGYNGFLVDNSAELWAARIVSLYNDPESRRVVSINGIGWVDKNYNPDKNIDIYTNGFRRLFS